jgi:photosystem II stability/assembly factor-like uncharacterized protein
MLVPGFASADWVQQQSGTTASLSRVFFLNPQTGWACGENCFVLRTTNGGQLWQRDTVDPIFSSFFGLWFRDASQGWVCGVTDSAGHMISAVFSTTDGGLNWQKLYTDTTNVLYFDLEFVTSLKGWLIGVKPMSNGGGEGYLYYTSDGGVSWVLRDSSRSTLYSEVSFADSLYGFLAAGNPGVTQSFGFLKKTTDGGSTWQMLLPGPIMYRRVHCLDRNHIWRSEYFHNDPNPNRWGVSKSSNGGVGWQSVLGRTRNLIPGPPFAVVDTLKTWVLVRDTLYGSRDGGLTWITQEPYSYMNNLCFVDSMNGWIVGNQGLILHTKDGGSSVWEDFQGCFQPLTSNLSFSVFPNPFTSFAILPGHEAERFSLYDISGRKVGTYRGDRVGEGLAPGVYFLRSSDSQDKPLRIVKVR